MRFGFKQPLVGEKRCVTTPITAAEETRSVATCFATKLNNFSLQRSCPVFINSS